MSKLRIGVVGAGNIATNAHMPAYAECDKITVRPPQSGTPP